MRKTQTNPLMQGARPDGHLCVPPAPVLEEDPQSILSLPSVQRLDIAALVREISDVRHEMTAQGRKQIVDVTIVDGSKKNKQTNKSKCRLSSPYSSRIPLLELRC